MLTKENKLQEAEDLCLNNDSVISRLIKKGLKRAHRPLIEIESVIESQANVEISKIERNLSYLATISGAAPMIGFLGTVIGMILAFHEMANAGGSNVDVKLLSTGIYTAMITTVAGLIVGIGAYISYNILVSKVSKIVKLLSTKKVLVEPKFTSDSTEGAGLWKLRKGLFPSVGNLRKAGTTVIIEDFGVQQRDWLRP